MSWQAYVDNSLVGTGCVTKGALHGHDGSLWATSAGFSVSKDEALKIINGFTNPGALQTNGFTVHGTKYRTLKADENSIYGRFGATGVVCCKTGQCLIIAMYDENIQPGQCTNVTEKLSDYLREAGY
uniref:Profilin n=1 Tax=Paramoeba aestuarina TaxID=180227 RepID=A0A7S4NSJ5_9EUKA|mmetsp:Transcript_25766/g.40216  ORF Transcript_25766/g.40216 Transcript_25766/m.40216 type:complete len:127 (+) Transcript_25766:77-457(+)|eukprot:CAMPEP_0201506164 /NCGR_PEP_ID=MMETSP0161_2-20130828/87_1 /ASSEMBLY_ACC=CAM_ASM_000251 /TAXON_ID=180227 /ORGANISM="Neoparamoeba aestuarina, Strain SoJaBio B1-5/56/2" /LENGTH=126 /DNA_ID=CAMNT_0047900189 /DNA_START=59 /DNA_END=439 /DNA_ORIENTATION=-